MATLYDPVPAPGPAGPFGTMAWLRATVSRFANGEAHARRRALVTDLLDAMTPQVAPVDEVPRQYLPVAALGAAQGVTDLHRLVADVRIVAAAYHPGTQAPGADEALQRVLEQLDEPDEERAAQRVAILVQACEATAALIRGETLPVKATKRVDARGTIHLVPLEGRPFGEGPRRCPGEHLALRLAEEARR